MNDQVDERDRRIAELERLVYVPGAFHCAKCDFSLTSTKFHVPSGSMSADSSPHDCPNGCGPMQRLTERDAGTRLVDRLDEARDKIETLRLELKTILENL